MKSSSDSTVNSKVDGALTIDLEDWRSALYPRRGNQRRYQTETNVAEVVNSTRMLLDELDYTSTRATFFVLGDLVRAAPDILEEISKRGHEVASHSPIHVPPHVIPRAELIRMIRDDVKFIEDVIGSRPLGFRAPYFAVRRKDGWLLETLSNLGFKYDSSVVPTWTPLYGIPYAPKSAYFPSMLDIGKTVPEGRIIEFPVTVWPSWSHLPGIPIGGGFFLKMWPLRMTKFGLRRNRKSDLALVLYLHPGDVDEDKVRVQGMSLMDSTIQHFGLGRGMSNLRVLLKDFRLTTISEAFCSVLDAIRD